MKKIFILMALFLSACGAPVSALTTEYRTPQATQVIGTATPSPTATIEYQATAHAAETQAYIAQSTADAANRIMVQATNDQQQRDHETQMQYAAGTQQSEAEVMVKLGWTATAASTSIPLTQTQQVIANTQIPAQQTMAAAQMTATAQAPTQIVAIANAREVAKFARLRVGVEIFALFSIAMFLLFAAYMMRWYWIRQDAREHAATPKGVAERNGFSSIPNLSNTTTEFIRATPEVEKPMVITVKQNYGGGMGTLHQMAIPCKPNQLLELAEKLLVEKRSLAINQWEGAESPFTRDEYGKVRAWLQTNRFAASTGGGALAMTDAGRDFLQAYLNTQTIPTEYQFEETFAEVSA